MAPQGTNSSGDSRTRLSLLPAWRKTIPLVKRKQKQRGPSQELAVSALRLQPTFMLQTLCANPGWEGNDDDWTTARRIVKVVCLWRWESGLRMTFTHVATRRTVKVPEAHFQHGFPTTVSIAQHTCGKALGGFDHVTPHLLAPSAQPSPEADELSTLAFAWVLCVIRWVRVTFYKEKAFRLVVMHTCRTCDRFRHRWESPCGGNRRLHVCHAARDFQPLW